MDEEQNKEVGRFVFGIRMFSTPQGKLEWNLEIANREVPTEIIIMQMKRWLQHLEKEFHDKFE